MGSRAFKQFLISILFIYNSISVFAIPFDSERHYRILNAEEPFEPYISNGVILFSYDAPKGTQMVFLALKHEQYRQFYEYKRNAQGLFVLSLELPEKENELHYRIVVDGLWSIDPYAKTVVDPRGISVSSITLPLSSTAPPTGVKLLPNGSMQFVYKGTPSSRVSLIGDFNRWDPYLMPMMESPVHPGVYSITLAIPPEFLLYSFVVDGKAIVDPENEMRQSNGWGEQVSLLPTR